MEQSALRKVHNNEPPVSDCDCVQWIGQLKQRVIKLLWRFAQVVSDVVEG
jgi:hypothetical protein